MRACEAPVASSPSASPKGTNSSSIECVDRELLWRW
jgi:hypothetical protein